MRCWSVASSLTLLASLASAVAPSGNKVAVYWGFGKERSLASYCAAGQGIDILIIGSVTPQISGGYPTGIFGSNCEVEPDGSFTDGCADVAQDIGTCQDAGVQILVGLSSYGKWGINGESGAQDIATALWQSYGGDRSNMKIRPFGNVRVDGWDFDIESNPKNQSQLYLGDTVNDLRNYFSDDTTQSWYISGAPECAIPDQNMGVAMMEAQFDYIWIQFYNNACSAADLVKNSRKNPDGQGVYNFDKWPGYLAGGASSSAQLFVGLAASSKAATTYDWVSTPKLPKVIAASSGMSGIMLWNTAFSDAATYHGCTYAQNIASLFSTGSVCSR